MQVSVETTEGLERKMTIAVPGEQVDSAVKAKLNDAAKTVKLNGFRQGKVPFKVVKDKFGEGVRQEVVGELMNQTFYDAINEQGLRPAGQPRIEATKLKEGQDIEFIAVFEVYPEITLPDFSAVAVNSLSADIDEADVDEMIETLRKQRQSWQVAERAAVNEDMVNIDFTGRKDGEEFAGGDAKGSSLVLGSERMIPGFETGIIGKSAGDNFILPLEFPADYQSEDLAGQKVEFEITLNSVSEQALPAVDEEFYKSFGVEEGGLEAFREEVVNNMNREMKTASRNKVKTAIMDAIIDSVDIIVPAALVKAETEQLKTQALQQMGGGGQNLDPSMLPDELFADQASRRVTLGLVLGEIIKVKELKADPSKVRAAVEELASTYESPEDVVNWYYSNDEQLASIESGVLEDQVFDHILEQASVTDTKVSYQDVIKPEEKKTVDDDSDAEIADDK
ncbi:MAG: trigger factor [Pseudohongiellaceae bacterium]|jgi:trigger factor